MIIPDNPAEPAIMHIDLNSAFAMIEQQANPFLRGKPVGITNRLNDWAICITASYEAKRQGISIGTRWREARWKDPSFVMIESDPEKYRYIHQRMRSIFESYSPVAYMKSIDEGIIDFSGMNSVLKGRSLEEIALEVKQRVKDEVGDYMTVNIGIGQNLWLAKVAAGFNKPDGLLMIRPGEQEDLFETMQLTDLPYIKKRWQRRLNDAGIYSAADFYRAPYWVLFRQVFKSVNGHHWYLKLRGYETEIEPGIRTIGRNYVLEHRTSDPEEFKLLLYKACVKVARRLRSKGFSTRGLMMTLRFADRPNPKESWGRPVGWFERQMWDQPASRADQLYRRACIIYDRSPKGLTIAHFSLTSYGLVPIPTDQPTLFDDEEIKRNRLEEAVHTLNDRYGELTVQPASVAMSKNPMKDKVPFGTVRYFD